VWREEKERERERMGEKSIRRISLKREGGGSGGRRKYLSNVTPIDGVVIDVFVVEEAVRAAVEINVDVVIVTVFVDTFVGGAIFIMLGFVSLIDLTVVV
jgi:hypothetical protein